MVAEKLIPLVDAFEEITGKRYSAATMWRWQQLGVNGVPLPYTQVGSKGMITLSAARQWLADCTDAHRGRHESYRGHDTGKVRSGQPTAAQLETARRVTEMLKPKRGRPRKAK